MVDGGPGRVAGSWGPNLLLTVLGSSAVAVGAFIYLYGFPGESRDGERAESPGRTRSGSSSSASSWSSFSSTTSFSFLTASCPSMFWSNARLRARDVVGRAVAAVNSAGRWCCSSALSASEGTSSSRWRDRLAAAYYEYDDAQNPAHRLASADSCPRDVVRRDEFTRACDAFRRAQLKGHMTIEEQLNLYGLFQQATKGNRNTPQPSKLDFVGVEKWKAWGSRTGLSRPQAREFYIEAWRAVLRRRLSGGSADLSTASLAAGPGAAPVSVLAQPVGASDEDDVRSDIGCLCQLTSDGDVPGVCALLLRAPAAIRGTNSKGMTPLHLAADRGLVKLAELLIQKGASIDHADDEGETALHTAVMAERVEMINLLLRHGADASLQNHDGDTAEQLARTACTCPDVARAFANPQSTAP
eukprot:GHVT01080559.1.p1 GENE.GHVT01080559.1~~GHVT01080559.1.p1  ORF type:complete len:414 (+),score=81.98 GHVT01080559.1:631-1872(+)